MKSLLLTMILSIFIGCGTDIKHTQKSIDKTVPKLLLTYKNKSISLNDEMEKILHQYISDYKSLFRGQRLIIKGFTDPRGDMNNNYRLGLLRANGIKVFLNKVDKDISKITVVSLGGAKPVCKQKSLSCVDKNNRVELSFLP